MGFVMTTITMPRVLGMAVIVAEVRAKRINLNFVNSVVVGTAQNKSKTNASQRRPRVNAALQLIKKTVFVTTTITMPHVVGMVVIVAANQEKQINLSSARPANVETAQNNVQKRQENVDHQTMSEMDIAMITTITVNAAGTKVIAAK